MPRRQAESSSGTEEEVAKKVPKKRGRASKKTRADSDSEASPGKGRRKSGAGSKLSEEECKSKARDLVRLALANEINRRPLKRDEITKRVLGDHSRAFNQVLKVAQDMLNRTFGYDLVELRSKNAGPDALLNGTGGGGKKAGKGKKATEDAEEDSSEEDDNGLPIQQKKATSSGPKQYILRSRLPEKLLVAAAAVPAEMPADDDPNSAVPRGDREGDDLHKALEVDKEAFQEWRVDDGSLFDLKRGDSLPGMALVHVLLGIILVNERRCPDDKFRVLLKTLGLKSASELPYNPSTAPALVDKDKMTLDKFLDQLIRQGYLEKHVNKRLQNPHADLSNGDPAVEWLWGARADAEIGEQKVAAFVLETFFPTGAAKELEDFKTKGLKDLNEAAGSKLRGATGMKAES